MMKSNANERRPSLKQSITRSISNLTARLQRLASFTSKSEEKDIALLVAELKIRFYQDYEIEKELYNASDVQLFLENEQYNYPARYLARTGLKVGKAVEMIKQTMKWRKEEGLSYLTDISFPKICYQYGIFFPYGQDMQGNLVLHIRYKLYLKHHPAGIDTFEKFFFYIIFKIDQLSSSRKVGWVACADLSGVTVRQWDVKHMLLMLKVYNSYCPAGFKQGYIYGLNWALRPLFKAALAVIPSSISSLMITVDKDSLFGHISQENLPRYLGGTCENDPREIPDGCPEDEDYFLGNYQISAKSCKELVEKYHKVLDKTDW